MSKSASTDPKTSVMWACACWTDPMQPPEARVSAAIAWMCLTDIPVPGELRAILDDLATEETARL
ncbi:hypothetical protein ACWGKW_32750 [Streptomyces sp. NPDC054766]